MKSKYTYIYSLIVVLIIISFVFFSNYSSKFSKPNIKAAGSELLNAFVNNVDGHVDTKLLDKYVINVENESSTDAIRQIIDNNTNLSIIDRDLSSHEKTMLSQKNINVVPYAKTYYALITNNENKLSNVSLDGLKKLVNNFKTTWNEIDPNIKTGNANFILPKDNLEYLEQFWKHLFTTDQNNLNYRDDLIAMKNIQQKQNNSKYDTYESIINAVKNDKNAIAIIPYSLINNNDEIKVVTINNAKVPIDNFINSKYPYKLTISLLYNNTRDSQINQETSEVVDVLTSQEFKQKLVSPGKVNFLVPVK